MKWIVDVTEYNDVEEAADYIVEQMSEEDYDEMLDECFGDINICGIDYCASVALYRIDVIAYNCGFNDYKDSCRVKYPKQYTLISCRPAQATMCRSGSAPTVSPYISTSPQLRIF